ncbi:hypothetical protein CQ018_06115 [Arthrobacter sp. MYb227]|uniref:DUF6186 family protein n=1 Tax=Arthrobacter sp. MYb227 TaxID=1848601 RepID=UPI000CFE1E18|nr:DUF6186 family protein [Arthrobacter sp. MYb227]PQZ94912.1 hypothetical protein CQ018_06115 [Arthrobacter sp. MYb227]
MTRDIAIIGYLSVPLMLGALILFSRFWPNMWASPTDVLSLIWQNRAARMTLLIFVWWFGWHFLLDG